MCGVLGKGALSKAVKPKKKGKSVWEKTQSKF